jgi:hypothetical protein
LGIRGFEMRGGLKMRERRLSSASFGEEKFEICFEIVTSFDEVFMKFDEIYGVYVKFRREIR